MQLLQQLLATMHDSNANQAKFKSKFTGDCSETIRFVFAIQEYEDVTNFQHPDSLFISIYNALPHHIQVEFSADKTNVIQAQQAALDNNSTADEIATAAIYSSESMQEFFVRNYRPTVQRGKIFRQLHSIYMRQNESPRSVIDRMVAAIQYAKSTIELLNQTNPDNNDQMANITDADITELMSRAFCSNNNNNTTNIGKINILMQKKFRTDKPRYDHATTGFTPFYTIANAIVSDLGTMWYARDPQYKIQHYEPLPLPLWETPRPKQNASSKAQFPNRPRKRTRFNSRNRSHQPPYKRQRYNAPQQINPQPSNPSRHNIPQKSFNTRRFTLQQRHNPQQYHQRHFASKSRNNFNSIKCYRCGKRQHTAKECASRHDANRVPLHPNDRRNPSQWPFRPQLQPRANTNPHPQRTPTRTWKQYSSGTDPSSNTHNSQSTSTSNSSKLLSMIADLRDTACEDTHIDPSILLAIDEIRNKIKPPNDSQPRH